MTPISSTMAAPSTEQHYRYDPNDPSYYRRKSLDSEGGGDGFAVSSFFPITRYYDASGKVLAAFDEAYGKKSWDDAFVYGKRYCTFVIEAIPKHDYYLSAKYAKQKNQSTKNVQATMRILENIKEIMNNEEREKHKQYLERQRLEALRLAKERKRQEEIQRQREAAKYQELKRRAELQKKSNAPAAAPQSGGNVESSAMNKLQMLMKQSSTSNVSAPAPPAAPPARPSGRYFLSDTDDEEDANAAATSGGVRIEMGKPLPPPLLPPSANGGAHTASTGSLPPPISAPPSAPPGAPPSAPPGAPPSYEFAANPNRRNPFLGRSDAPFALPPPVTTWENSNNNKSNSGPRPPSYTSLPDPPTKRYPSQPQAPVVKKKKKIPVRHLRDQARRTYNDFISQGRIEIRPVDTYQGRYSQSTNGCTVISPLVVARHLGTTCGVVLPDSAIKEVIDRECGPLLREIRGKLGLEAHSLIIPSDVHDHLVDKHILKQDYFVGATGGNIISDEHMGEFIKLFQEKIKAGAALFFHEHVVSIVKQPVGNGKAYYDLVDSMPGGTDSRGNPCATRTRCKDKEALDVLLTWYATKKFSESNCSYIDHNDWNEMMAEIGRAHV